MKLFKMKKLHNDESGAVTVDWVVLTAAIVGLGLAVIATVRTASLGLATKISVAIDGIEAGDTTP